MSIQHAAKTPSSRPAHPLLPSQSAKQAVCRSFAGRNRFPPCQSLAPSDPSHPQPSPSRSIVERGCHGRYGLFVDNHRFLTDSQDCAVATLQPNVAEARKNSNCSNGIAKAQKNKKRNSRFSCSLSFAVSHFRDRRTLYHFSQTKYMRTREKKLLPIFILFQNASRARRRPSTTRTFGCSFSDRN